MRFFVLLDGDGRKSWIEVKDMQAASRLVETLKVDTIIASDSFALLEQVVKDMDERLEEAITRLSGSLR